MEGHTAVLVDLDGVEPMPSTPTAQFDPPGGTRVETETSLVVLAHVGCGEVPWRAEPFVPLRHCDGKHDEMGRDPRSDAQRTDQHDPGPATPPHPRLL